MPDREKVIKGLQAHADGCGYRSHHCDAVECPYRYGDESCDIEEMCRDALALLKEQETVEPRAIRTNGFGDTVYACGKCGLLITESMNYCHECGKRIKWEGR